MVVWRTSSGDRVLHIQERNLFVRAAACLLDHLEEEIGDCDADIAWPTGVVPFDSLEPQARIVLLRDIVQALTDPAVPTPDLTAITEAAVHAIYRFILHEIGIEIDFRRDLSHGLRDLPSLVGYDPCSWRKLVLAAYLEGRELDGDTDRDDEDDEDEENLDPDNDDMDEWELRLECLADQILWDRDWELDQIMDAPPEEARLLKQHLGIDEDYFLATPARSTEAEVHEAVTFLRRLAGEDKVPDQS